MDCIETYPDYGRMLDSWDPESLSSREAVRDYLDAKRRWEVHSATCPQAHNKNGAGPDERSLTEPTRMQTTKVRQKPNKPKLPPPPHRGPPLEGELDVVKLFTEEEYQSVSRTIRSILTQCIPGDDSFVFFSNGNLPREKFAYIVQKIFEEEPKLQTIFKDAWSLCPLITMVLSTSRRDEEHKDTSRPRRPLKRSLKLAIPTAKMQVGQYQSGENHYVASARANPPTLQVPPYAGYQVPGTYQVPNGWTPSVEAPVGPSLSYKGSAPLDGSVAWDPSSQAITYGTGAAGPPAFHPR